MRSFFKFAILFLLFYNIIFLSYVRAAESSLKIDENEKIHAMASNGNLLVVVLPTRIVFCSLTSNSSNTLLTELFVMEFENQRFDQDFNFELLPDNRFVLCSVDSCRLYKVSPAEKTARILLEVNAGAVFNNWSAIVLGDKLLVNYLPVNTHNAVIKSFDLKQVPGRISIANFSTFSDNSNIGIAADHVSIVQEESVFGFKKNGYSYFISTVRELDLYSSEFLRVNVNVTRTRLTRICNSDGSKDLVTKINIHLACGDEQKDYAKTPSFHFESAFLSTDRERLFVLFNSKEYGYSSCSYPMIDIDNYFDNVWDHCQHIENKQTFEEECLTDRRRCSFSWMRTSPDSRCERFGKGFTKHTFTNCAASGYNATLSRKGWLENFIPVWGKAENKFPERQTFAGLDDNTFMSHSEGHILKRMPIAYSQNLPLWNKAVDKFITVQSGANQQSYIVYSRHNQVEAQQISCSALYPNCSSIRWDDPLQCAYCAFSNSTGYVTKLGPIQNQTCIKNDGRVIVNECPPVIQKVAIGGSDITIVGDFLTNFKDPQVFVCNTQCDEVTFQPSVISCRLDDVNPTCDVTITGALSSTSDFTVYYAGRNNDDTDGDQEGSTPGGSSTGRVTKFVVGIVVAIFFLATIGVIAYIITTKRVNDLGLNTPIKPPYSQHTNFMRTLDALPDPFPYNSVNTTEPRDFDSNLELYGVTAFPEDKIEKIATIGKGNFAIVFKYRYRDRPYGDVAVKEILDGDMREVKLVSRCEHPNIVRYFGYFANNEGRICLVMEYLGGGDLHKYLINRDNHFNCRDGFDFVQQIASGMKYLAENDIIHRDLAARNCILSQDLKVVKISDFGLGRRANLNGEYQPIDRNTKLPFRWTALECLNGDGFNEKSDVWSFGIVAWEVFSREKMPYPEIRSGHDLQQYLGTGERLPHPGEGCPEELYEVMCSCWSSHPDDRPTFAQLCDTLENVINDLNQNDVDYEQIYLTPRVSMNESHSTPTIMNDSDVSTRVREISSPNGHITS